LDISVDVSVWLWSASFVVGGGVEVESLADDVDDLVRPVN
jgi:hypothetical protein